MVSGGLLDRSAVRELAIRLDLRPTKQRGQNFVTDANTVRRIVNLAGLTADDTVLEIGPGLGSLTLGLLEVAAHVDVVEIEPSLARQLPRTVTERMPALAQKLTVREADALQLESLGDPAPSVVVANLPYNVSVPVLLHLLALASAPQPSAPQPSAPQPTAPQPDPPEGQRLLHRGLVMVQLEVADRLVAGPGSKTYGVPSVKLAWYASARRIGTVPPSVFWPVPNVDSGLVSLERRDPPPTSATREQVFAVIDAAFGQRRKMLRAALAGICGSSAQATAALERAGVDPQVRGEVLVVEQFARIAEQVFSAGAPDGPSGDGPATAGGPGSG